MSLYLNIFAQFQCNDTVLKITYFSDDFQFLRAFHLKFTINANFVYIPVQVQSGFWPTLYFDVLLSPSCNSEDKFLKSCYSE